MNATQTDYQVPTDNGGLLRARLISPANVTGPVPVVMMLTGDGPKGSKSQSWTELPPILAQHGIASFLFDFEGLGYSEGDRRRLTVDVGLSNFRSAFHFLTTQMRVNKDRIGVLASSFGATVLLVAPDIANQFKAIGLKSPAPLLAEAYVAEVGIDAFDKWQRDGHLERNGYDFVVLENALCWDALQSARRIKQPCLITHGDADSIVSLVQSKLLALCLSGRVRLEVFAGVGHGYSEGDAWQRMANMFASWFENEL